VGLVLRERFELVEELGRGGMGVVYKAIDQREIENKGREPHVAIKVLNEEFKRHPESARALQRESKKAMRLAHPNIVLVRDFDRDRGNVFMVMELLHGTPLDRLILKQYPKGMPFESVIEIVNGLGAALSYAHQQGIVHADFKPSNAFLTSQNTVKVLDFGVARVALALDRGESTLFDAGKLNAVSPAYASIELLIGEAPDPRDDIYALACVTYYLLTGRHPFNGIDAMKARDSALLPLPIHDLPEPQWRALRAALVFDRWERTPSVRQFLTQFCTIERRRPSSAAVNVAVHAAAGAAAGVVERASRMADGAGARLGRGTARVADAAAKRPWWFAAPAALALIAGLAAVVAHRLPQQGRADDSATQAVVAASSPEAAAPANLSTPTQQLQQRLAALDPAAPDFIDAVVAASADIGALDAVNPDDPVLQKLRSAVFSTMAAQVESDLMRGDLNGARKLIAKVRALLPADALRSYTDEALSQRQDLVRLMVAADANQRWADRINAAIAGLAAVAPGDDPLIRDAREMSDTTFQLAAEEARNHGRLDEAREYLAVGLTVHPQSPALTRAALDLAATAPAAQGVAPATAAVMPPKTQPTPTPTPTPAATLAPAPRSLDAFMAQARQQMSQGDMDAALQTIADGRRKFGGSQPLKDLEITYDRVAEEVERINMAPFVHVRDHAQWLSEIRSLAGDDYPQIEQMLARALANDIADQRLRPDRSRLATELLASGRMLFPEYAALLEHGKAGTLDESQVASVESSAVAPANTRASK
jgi:serine/threonine protein kinase